MDDTPSTTSTKSNSPPRNDASVPDQYRGFRVNHVIKDLTGKKFNYLTVISFRDTGPSGARWNCKCSCGKRTIAASCDLQSNKMKSCGCLKKKATATLGKRNVLTDILGKRFGRLVVKKYSGKGYWVCQCNCGNRAVVHRHALIKKITKSCGCYRRERASKLNLAHGQTRNRSPSVEHTTWTGMKQRCYNPSHVSYPDYGGRGIIVCDRWLYGEGVMSGFDCFFSDMGKKPSAEYSIDRYPDNDGNYEPENCRWATAKQQAANKNRR